jgi:TolB-like protein/DNA-binding winged helix-turn-helix (wHTH) protein/Tfp pilus assembly protein PilF
MTVALRPARIYFFAQFRLEPARQTLLQGAVRVNLSARLFNTLVYLVTHHDRVVTREELEAALWPSRTIEENNLPQAIYALRKAIPVEGADSLIVTVPGRGYQFGLPVRVVAAPDDQVETIYGDAPSAAEPASIISPARRQVWWLRRPVLLILAVTIALAAFAWVCLTVFRGDPSAADTRDAAIVPPPHSVAVLPFANLSGDPAEEYFSDGLSEELLDSLGRIGALHVAASTSSFALKGKPASVQEIGRLLHVRTVLEGSVRRDGNQLRITSRLTDATTGYLIWSHSFESDRGGILLLQQALAEAVTNAVQGRLLVDDVAKLRLGGTNNAAALDAFLLGMKYRNQYTQDGMERALVEFERALTLDPNYTLAHVQHADILILSAQGHGGTTSDPARVRKMQDDALTEARAAVAAAPDLGEAHRVLSLAYAEIWDFRRESQELARARELAPSNSQVLMSYARLEVDSGRNAHAIDLASQAVALDPLAPELYADLATVFWFARRSDDMLVALRHAEQLGFGGAPADDIKARAALMTGDAAAAARICAGRKDWVQEVCLAIADHRLGKQADAAAALARLRDLFGDNGAYQYAQIYAAWGQPGEALNWLEIAYRVRDDGLLDVEADSIFDSLRQTPRFKAIEDRLELK